MAEAQEAVNRSAVRKPSGGMAGCGSPGRRQYGNRPPFKNGSIGLSKTNKVRSQEEYWKIVYCSFTLLQSSIINLVVSVAVLYG